MLDFSPIQIILVLGIALLVLGPKRLPSMAKSLGHGLRGFRDSLAGKDDPDERPAATVVVVTTDPVQGDQNPSNAPSVETVRLEPTAVNDTH